MKIRKETPSWFIVADTKINTQSFGKYTESLNIDADTNWIKSNGKAQTVSMAEKLLETLALDFLGITNENSIPSNEFFTKNFSKLETLFDHFNITIVFNEVSHLFIQNILLQKLSNYHINQKRFNDMSIWLPPLLEHPIHSTIFGRTIGDIVGNIDGFIQQATEHNLSLEDATKMAFTLMPNAQHSKVIITASMSGWRQILTNLSKFGVDIETRYIITHLCRDLKLRYFGFFSDLVMSDGKSHYGADSITNEGFWQKVEIVKKPLT
jgi:hypothetical protein